MKIEQWSEYENSSRQIYLLQISDAERCARIELRIRIIQAGIMLENPSSRSQTR